MFAFAVWDEAEGRLFCARDRFGIKPLYYTVVDGTFICASEAKALVPFLPAIETDLDALKDYLAFQFCLAGKTLFRGIHELLPGHTLTVRNGVVRTERYWEVQFEPDFGHTETWFTSQLRELIDDSVDFHLRADVPVGAYLSGGLDSSITTALAARRVGADFQAFTGKFTTGDAYDESALCAANSPRSTTSACTRRRSTRPISSRTSARSSTTSIIRWRAPDRSRSTWSRSSLPDT